MNIKLVALLVLNIPAFKAFTMIELFQSKYADVYNPRTDSVLWVNEDGVEEIITLPQPMPLYSSSLTDREFLEKLRNFENNPSEFFMQRRSHTFLIRHAIRDFDSDPYSREIIQKCLEYGPGEDFIFNLMDAAIQYDRIELFDDLIEKYSALPFDQYLDFFFSIQTPICSVITQTGKYEYAKKLIISGIQSAPNKYYARSVCLYGPDWQKSVDFLDFLIVQRQDVNVNELIYAESYIAHGFHVNYFANPVALPLILILLKSRNSTEYKEKVGKYLISIGADLEILDEDGHNVLEVAEALGINLFD